MHLKSSYSLVLQKFIFRCFLFLFAIQLVSCGSSNPIPGVIGMFVNVSQETLNDIPPDSHQIILINSNTSSTELYNAILNKFLEEGYRVSVNLEDKLVLGTDFDLNRNRNISSNIHRIDVSIKESADGVIAVFTCEFIKASNSLFGENKDLGKKAQWNKNTEESYYFAIMLEFAQMIPSSKISYSLP